LPSSALSVRASSPILDYVQTDSVRSLGRRTRAFLDLRGDFAQ